MEYPWNVIGWEMVPKKNDETKFNVRLYVERPLDASVNGEGTEAQRLYYNPEYVKYEPHIGDMIIATEGRYGIDRIFKVA